MRCVCQAPPGLDEDAPVLGRGLVGRNPTPSFLVGEHPHMLRAVWVLPGKLASQHDVFAEVGVVPV